MAQFANMKIGNRYIYLISLVTVIAVFLWFNRPLIEYALGQAAGQLRILIKAVPIREVLKDPSVPDRVKGQLELIGEVRKFAVDSLGILPTENYTTFYDQKGRDLLWLVTASEAFELKAFEWKFPFLGTFSYKGFFDSLKAVDASEQLGSAGYDTDIRVVGGWSTLGYFKDPVLSKMLDRDEAELAELIIHELTHGTIYVRDSTQFNENLATFIGIKGAERFLSAKYGSGAEVIEQYKLKKLDQQAFADHILRGTLFLDSTYKSMDSYMTLDAKRKLKKQAIAQIIETSDTLSLSRPGSFRKYLESIQPNNTYFMSYRRYRGYLKLLEEEFTQRYNWDIRRLLLDYKSKYPSL